MCILLNWLIVTHADVVVGVNGVLACVCVSMPAL